MQVHRNKRLFDLAQKHAQHQRLAELAQSRDKSLHALWSGRSHIYHPETPITIKDAYSRCTEAHKEDPSTPRSALRKLRTSSRERAYAWLLVELLALPDRDYTASFGAVSYINFNANTYWIPDLPVTQLTSAEVTAIFRAEDELPFEQLALTSIDGSASLVLDSYMGFLPEEPSKDETLYELATFRDA